MISSAAGAGVSGGSLDAAKQRGRVRRRSTEGSARCRSKGGLSGGEKGEIKPCNRRGSFLNPLDLSSYIHLVKNPQREFGKRRLRCRVGRLV